MKLLLSLVLIATLASCTCKPWMVGSKNDCIKCCGPFAKVPGGTWTEDFEPSVQAEVIVVDEKQPVERITK